ncbi:MAG TPA: 2Fe-2S iron-sulfur cluster-binding protein [Burkholderiaceae bacterium]|jgi:ferredoxin|nr:2Fe-2S iron-sulfur cluster-binding protein [Burkholderiaceae bacterium]
MSEAFIATVRPSGLQFAAPASMPLLHAAQRAGIRLAASCRNGTCRTCMCRLTSGSIRYHIEWPGLLAEEKAQGFILPCVAHAASDLVIEGAAVE